MLVLQAAEAAVAESGMTAAEWMSAITALLVAIGTIVGLGKKVWTLKNAIRAGAKAVDAFKREMEAAATPEVAKSLTAKIGAELEGAGAAVKRAHAVELMKAGANLVAILGPAIAKRARPQGEGDGA